MSDLSELTDQQLQGRHTLFMLEVRVAQAAGNRDEAYRYAQELRRMTAEMSLRVMTRVAA